MGILQKKSAVLQGKRPWRTGEKRWPKYRYCFSCLREETEGKLQMLLSPREKSLDSLFKEVGVFKVYIKYLPLHPELLHD